MDSLRASRTRNHVSKRSRFLVAGMGIGKQGLFLMEVIELIKPLVFFGVFVGGALRISVDVMGCHDRRVGGVSIGGGDGFLGWFDFFKMSTVR